MAFVVHITHIWFQQWELSLAFSSFHVVCWSIYDILPFRICIFGEVIVATLFYLSLCRIFLPRGIPSLENMCQLHDTVVCWFFKQQALFNNQVCFFIVFIVFYRKLCLQTVTHFSTKHWVTLATTVQVSRKNAFWTMSMRQNHLVRVYCLLRKDIGKWVSLDVGAEAWREAGLIMTVSYLHSLQRPPSAEGWKHKGASVSLFKRSELNRNKAEGGNPRPLRQNGGTVSLERLGFHSEVGQECE